MRRSTNQIKLNYSVLIEKNIRTLNYKENTAEIDTLNYE